MNHFKLFSLDVKEKLLKWNFNIQYKCKVDRQKDTWYKSSLPCTYRVWIQNCRVLYITCRTSLLKKIWKVPLKDLHICRPQHNLIGERKLRRKTRFCVTSAVIDSSNTHATNYISFILTAVVHVWEEGKYIFYYSRLNPRELANTLYHIELKVQFLTLSPCIHFDHAHKYACKAKPESNVNPKTNSELSKIPFEVKSQMSLLKA